jgi:hypothetical protein
VRVRVRARLVVAKMWGIAASPQVDSLPAEALDLVALERHGNLAGRVSCCAGFTW